MSSAYVKFIQDDYTKDADYIEVFVNERTYHIFPNVPYLLPKELIIKLSMRGIKFAYSSNNPNGSISKSW